MMFSKAEKKMENSSLSRKINSLLNAPGNITANQDDIQKAQRDAIAAAAAFLLTFPPMNTETTQKSEQKSESSADHQMPSLGNSPSQPISQRGNHWVHLGSFRNEEDMQRVKNKERVSKRRTEQLKNGIKVRYRCNTWKRTKCGFQMFTFSTTNTGIIDLYESGEHDHSGRRKLEYDLYGPIRRRNQNQGKGELDEESEGRNSNLASEIGEGSVERRLLETPSTSSEPLMGTTFSLAEADKNEKLHEMASKFGLTMTMENGNIYSVFYNGQIVLSLVESADSISVIGKEGEQRWIKADWAQFLWAILGRFAFLTKCLNDDK